MGLLFPSYKKLEEKRDIEGIIEKMESDCHPTIDFCINNGRIHFHRTHGKSEA